VLTLFISHFALVYLDHVAGSGISSQIPSLSYSGTAVFSSQEVSMEIINRHHTTSFFKCMEAFVKVPPRMDGEEYEVCLDSPQEQRSRIICAYLQVLEDLKGHIAAESELPFPKEQIGKAILGELSDGSDEYLRLRLEIAYVLLESFIPDEEFRVIEDFKMASLCAAKLADNGDPASILKSARMTRRANGDSAVRLQEKIYEKMRRRQLQIELFQAGTKEAIF